jgi:hypothetical protein
MDPAGNGTTIRISLAGHFLSCANAMVELSPNAEAPATLAAATRKSLRDLNIAMLCLRKFDEQKIKGSSCDIYDRSVQRSQASDSVSMGTATCDKSNKVFHHL